MRRRHGHGGKQPEIAKDTGPVEKSIRGNYNELITQLAMEYGRSMNHNKEGLKILQYNVMKLREGIMATLLRDPKIQEYDI
jgi:hypothetical protein